jgi:hypothetical protein
VEHGQRVPLPFERRDDESPDEAVAANEEDAHGKVQIIAGTPGLRQRIFDSQEKKATSTFWPCESVHKPPGKTRNPLRFPNPCEMDDAVPPRAETERS